MVELPYQVHNSLNAGATSTAIQAVSIATGLQGKFSWVGVAGAVAGAMGSAQIARSFNLAPVSAGNRTLDAYAGNLA